MIHYFNDISFALDKEKDQDNWKYKETTIEKVDALFQLPERFTYPFHYTPHPLIIRAAEEVKEYIQTRADWQEELSHGKMFGVLLIQSPTKGIGYLAAFSGNLAGSNRHEFFVPPVFDLLRPGDFFKIEESNISAINQRIKQIPRSDSYIALKEHFDKMRAAAELQLKEAKLAMKRAKKERDDERNKINRILLSIKDISSHTSSITLDKIDPSSKIKKYEERLAILNKESQFQKAEYKRLERKIKEGVDSCASKLLAMDQEIALLKQERKTRSAALQMKLFEHFKMLNARGEIKDLCQIFEETRQSIPPAGAGECALPKMLQYAYLHGLKPLAFGEFWWGESPKDEIRHHGQFYPSCKGKCEPILKHMLVGLTIDPNPLADDVYRDIPLKILYEDNWIVAIDKPAGMLSAPGKEAIDSVSERLKKMYPDATGPLLVHRLDMATSGILLAAKDKDIHAKLQALFEAREVIKIYTAILDGIPTPEKGCIRLPLCLNPMDRPRQMVNYELGKEAITNYKVLAKKEFNSLVEFELLTGRTHQIRMHAAHPLGLNCPIKGDDLYGRHADRLYLHATEVSFTHPITTEKVTIKSKVPFCI